MRTEESGGIRGRLFGVSCFLLLVSIVPTLFWSWEAYTYRLGDAVEVSFNEPCTSTRSRGTVSTDCTASWVAGSVRHDGTITDNNGASLPGAPGVVQARAWGDTARTELDAAPYRLGLAGPWLAVPSLLVILVLLPSLVWRAARDGWAEGKKARDDTRNTGGRSPPA